MRSARGGIRARADEPLQTWTYVLREALHRLEVIGGILEQESQELLQQFFRTLREKPVEAG